MSDRIPAYHELFNPVLEALRSLGGSATIAELLETVTEQMGLPDDVAEIAHGDGNQTEVGYRIAWARTYLKKFGLLDNSQRGVWSLTERGRKVEQVDALDVQRHVREMYQRDRERKSATEPEEGQERPEFEDQLDWTDEVLALVKSMDADAFERLCQRLLRESGFIEVEVTGKSGDAGIDGRGVLRIGGLISFTVMFQAKRYKDVVSSNVVRDFRGALMGRADKGLIITTGRFTADANREATRDGASPIDLIDGTLLVEKLKELELGIKTHLVEQVEVDPDWFDAI